MLIVSKHKFYDPSCTNRRTMEIFQDSGNRPIYFIRFNPDDYFDNNNKKITSCWDNNKRGLCVVKKTKQKEWHNRLETLKDTITNCLNNKPEKEVEVIHLFYDLCEQS